MAWSQLSNTVGPAAAFGGSSDYATLNLFESAFDGETPGGGTLTALCRGVVCTSTLYWQGWQSGMDNDSRIIVKADEGYETDGTNGDSASPDYKAIITTDQQLVMASNALYIDFVGLEFNTGYIYVQPDSGGPYQLQAAKNLFRDSPSTAVKASSVGVDVVVRIGGNLIKNCGSSQYESALTFLDDSITTSPDVCNNTIDGQGGTYWGINENLAQDVTLRNTVIVDTVGTNFRGTDDEENCASEDTSANGTDCITGISLTAGVDFTDQPNEDYTIPDDSSELYHTGTTQPAWFTAITGGTDLAGNNWHTTTPSIGCFEFAESTQLPINLTGGATMGATLTRRVFYNRTLEGAI